MNTLSTRRKEKELLRFNKERKALLAKRTNPMTEVWLSREYQVSQTHKKMRMKALIPLLVS